MSKLQKLLENDLKDYQNIPFWSWNDHLEEDELRRQIRQMKSDGIGGFFMHARGGLHTEYMGKQWYDAVDACIDEAKKQNMNAWLYDENGWPSGFAGMKLLEDEGNFAHYITYEIKDHYDKDALAVYKLVDNDIVRIYDNEDGIESFYCIYDKTNCTVVDILNKDIVRKFIDLTHQEYYKRFKQYHMNPMLGFFTDEPQYFRWDTAYTPVILEEYKKTYKHDILDILGALFIDCNQSYMLRFRYWRLMNKLYTESFAKQIYDWCEEYNCMLTGHVVEEDTLFGQVCGTGGAMPFYEYEHIPGIDWLGRNKANHMICRQVSSVAMQLGKKQVLTETYGCAGWDVTPLELKWIAESQYVHGVNLMCEHLLPYSIRGQRKRDYPAFYSEHNPWHKYFKKFNDYFTTLGYMLSESKEVANTAIIHPIHSAYFVFDRKNEFKCTEELNNNFTELTETLSSKSITHHYLDESLMEKYVKVVGDKLIMGECEYSYIVIPKMANLDSSTVEILKEYIDNGGKIYLDGDVPSYVDGIKCDLSSIKSNIQMDDMVDKDFNITPHYKDICSTFRKAKFGSFIYVVNTSNEDTKDISISIKAKGVKLFDLLSRKEENVYYEVQGEYLNIPLVLKPTQSYVVMMDDDAMPCPKPLDRNIDPIDIGTSAEVVRATENALTVDYVQLSYDNVTFEEKMPVMALSYRMLKEQTNRTIYLKYCFDVTEVPSKLYVETENMSAKNIWLNGVSIQIDEQGRLDRSFVRKAITTQVKLGTNEIVFEIDYYQDKHVYHTWFGVEGRTESLINCLSYDTDIEAIYLLGNFCVESKGGYKDNMKNTSMSQGDFSIVKSAETIDAKNINKQGYPFFAGDFTFEKSFNVESTDYRLRLKGRYAVATVWVNDDKVTDLMFDNECDISKYLKLGENKLKITLTNSNRNLLGPFHYKPDPEPFGVGPHTFNKYGTWDDNGESPLYSHEYAFVNFGLDRIELI